MADMQIKAPVGANKSKRSLGHGRGSGHGKTSGKGHKGQKSRSGGGTRPGFEGGQMPLYRRLASRGFSNAPFKVDYVPINLVAIEKCYEDGETVNLGSLLEKGLIKSSETRVKILGSGTFTKKLTIEMSKVSSGAREKIEKAGGSIVDGSKDQK